MTDFERTLDLLVQAIETLDNHNPKPKHNEYVPAWRVIEALNNLAHVKRNLEDLKKTFEHRRQGCSFPHAGCPCPSCKYPLSRNKYD